MLLRTGRRPSDQVYALRIRRLAMGHDHRDLSAEMLFVEPKRFLAVTVIVEVSVQFHCNRLFYWFRSNITIWTRGGESSSFVVFKRNNHAIWAPSRIRRDGEQNP